MGPSLANGEPEIDTFDWRTQLQSDERERIINMITETLKKQQLPFSGPDGINEHSKIASRFEQKVFSNAANLNDYRSKISIEMLSIETTVINAADSSTPTPTATNSTFLSSGPLMENSDWRHSSSLPYREPAMDTGDWRTRFPPDARGKIVNMIMETLEKHRCGAEGINELREIATRLEESIFNTADHQSEYLRQISMKLLLVKTNTGDWRTQQPPESRRKNVNKLMETLKKHVPYSGQEGIEELMRIAVSFEELIFNTALNQVDYFRKISLKMETMEEGN